MQPEFSIGEINVICSDIEESLHFYRDILGLSPVEQEDDAWHLRCGAQSVLLLPAAAQRGDVAPYCSVPVVSVDLMVKDLAAACRHFKAHNVAFDRDWSPDARSFHIRDPDGIVWEVIASARQQGAR